MDGDSRPHMLCFYECIHNEIDEVFCDRSDCSVPTEIYKKRFKMTGKDFQLIIYYMRCDVYIVT